MHEISNQYDPETGQMGGINPYRLQINISSCSQRSAFFNLFQAS